MKTTAVFFVLLFLAATAPLFLSAQTIDHRGREFRLVFMPTNGPLLSPQFGLAISSRSTTRGKITYMFDGTTASIEIPDPNQTVVFWLDSSKLLFEPEEEFNRKSLWLQFDDEVTIQGINTIYWSTDAFLALPIETLGTSYMVLGYPNAIRWTGDGFKNLDSAAYPSQFSIVAMQNETKVEIIPAAPLEYKGMPEKFTISLDAGEVFIAQATMERDLDLSGTELISDKPIAVFSGHQRTSIPYSVGRGDRDHLVEQLYPMNHWSREFIAIPPYQLWPKQWKDSAFVRILTADEHTVITIDGDIQYEIERRKPFQIFLEKAKLISSTSPVLIAQYHPSGRRPSAFGPELMTYDTVSGPFMMLVPAIDQYQRSYTFESFITPQLQYHFVNVVIPTDAVGTLRLDGEIVDAHFLPVPKTSFSYASIEVSGGSHIMAANKPFGALVYGFGTYNSYGYPAGLRFSEGASGVTEPHGEGAGEEPLALRLIGTGDRRTAVVRLEQPDNIRLSLFDMRGERIRTVHQNLDLPAGEHHLGLSLDGLAGGVYILQAETVGGRLVGVPLYIVR